MCSRTVFFLLALCLAATAAMSANQFHRSVKASTSADGHTFWANSTRSDTTNTSRTVDRLGFTVATDFTPRTTVAFWDLTTAAGQTGVVGLFNRWRLWKLIEFVKGPLPTTDPGFVPGNDTKLSQLQLWRLTWTPFTVNSTVDSNGANTYQVCSTGTNSSYGTSFSATFCAYATDSLRPTAYLTPNYIKWSLGFVNYPYNNTVGASNIALKFSFETVGATFTSTSALSLQNITRRPQNMLSVSSAPVGTTPSSSGVISTIASWDTTVSQIGGNGCAATANINLGTRYIGESQYDVDSDNPKDHDLESINASGTLVVAYYSVSNGGCRPASVQWDPYTGFDNSAQDIAPSGNSASNVAVGFVLVVLAAIMI